MEFDAPPGESETHDEAVIWRYMDLPRFVSMLSTGRLWFAKAATLHDDPYEGFGKAEYFVVASGDDSPKSVLHGVAGSKTNISLPEMRAHVSKMSADIFENARDHVYVNSWCLGPTESMAMWQIYGSLGFSV